MTLQMKTGNKRGLMNELAQCRGPVAAILPDGKRCSAATFLSQKGKNIRTPLELMLQIQKPCDYMRLACFAIGDV